jgi:hypothetical protein
MYERMIIAVYRIPMEHPHTEFQRKDAATATTSAAKNGDTSGDDEESLDRSTCTVVLIKFGPQPV